MEGSQLLLFAAHALNICTMILHQKSKMSRRKQHIHVTGHKGVSKEEETTV